MKVENWGIFIWYIMTGIQLPEPTNIKPISTFILVSLILCLKKATNNIRWNKQRNYLKNKTDNQREKEKKFDNIRAAADGANHIFVDEKYTVMYKLT